MLTIPLPIIASFLLVIAALVLRIKQLNGWQPVFGFLLLCALLTLVVGLRWTVNMPWLRFLQPILGACLPVAAWLCFASPHRHKMVRLGHGVMPLVVAVGSFNYVSLWPNLLDFLVTALSLVYGGALLYASGREPQDVRISAINRVRFAKRSAGILLLFSAVIDGAISADFMLEMGLHARLIISVSYVLLIPALALMVILASNAKPPRRNEVTQPNQTSADKPVSGKPKTDEKRLSLAQIAHIIDKFKHLMQEKQAFRDPDLTLSRIARKTGIPARQISAAVNTHFGENLSKVVNSYRIDYAKQRLMTTTLPITDIYLSAGFQTKSNFNREFSRITGQTPSAFRQSGFVNADA